MKSIVAALCFVCVCSGALGQRVCGTIMPSGTSAFSTNTVVTNGISTTNGYSRDTVSNEVINIPVIVHVIYKAGVENISDAQIISQIKVLNEDYRLRNATAANIPAAFKSLAADVRLNFCLAKVDPTGHSISGIVRKKTSKDFFLDEGMKYTAQDGDDAWDCKKYLNIWVCHIFGTSLGFATVPGGPADKDGVVINYDVFGTTGTVRGEFNLGRTATHEIGHWLGLKHLWGDTDCGSDDVDDTPRQRFPNYYCPTFPHATSCSPNANGDMFMNFMDFSDDACMSMFSQGQKMKMRALFAIGGNRNSFLNSFACDASLATAGPLPQDTAVVVATPAKNVMPPVSINIYPNPTTNMINISADENVDLNGQTIHLISTTGRIVMQQKLSSGRTQINVSSLSAGIYILQLGEGVNKKTFKLIKL